MNSQILVSIITPCFNSEKTIARTFEAMIRQTYQKIEYIVIDGGSTDGTLEIIREYEKNFPFLFRYVSEPDKGIYDAMNKGIRMATGKLIGIVNSDDYYADDAIKNIVDAYDGADYRILYGFQRNIKEGQETQIFINHHSQLQYMMITHPTCFVTKNIYNDFGVYDTTYRSSSDYEFMDRIYHQIPDCFVPVYHVISNFEEGGMSSTQLGVRETLKIKMKRGYISKFRYVMSCLYSRLVEVVQWFKRMAKSLNRTINGEKDVRSDL